MKTYRSKVLYSLTFAIAILGLIVTGIGVLYSTGGKAFEVINQYGSVVKLYGDGIYAHDSYFKAPIFRGTDLTILVLAIPLLLIALVLDRKKKSIKQRLFLTSMIAVFVYYSAGLAFGVTYNSLQLIYIALFSTSFFGLIISMMSFDYKEVEHSVKQTLSYKGISVFLILTGIALIVAWLPDIISALIKHQPLALIEVYTTEITYVLDIAIISPVALICAYLLKKRDGLGYILLGMILTICSIVGAMLPVQSLFQLNAGIEIPLPALITKIGIFCVLALFAVYYNVKLLKSVGEKSSNGRYSVGSIK